MNFIPLRITSISFPEALKIALIGFIIVFVALIVLSLFVKVLSSAVSALEKGAKSKPEQPFAAAAPDVPAAAGAPTAVYYPGTVRLENISEQNAAVVMALTSFKSGIPPERLSFRSIRLIPEKTALENISDQDAAVIMAVTSYKSGIPLENLAFKSIKLLED